MFCGDMDQLWKERILSATKNEAKTISRLLMQHKGDCSIAELGKAMLYHWATPAHLRKPNKNAVLKEVERNVPLFVPLSQT